MPRGSWRRPSIAAAAAASGGATMAPARSRPGATCPASATAAQATAAVVTSRATPASESSAPQCRRISRGGRSYAASSSAGAMKSASASAGSMPIDGDQGSAATTTPATASMVGYGIASLRETCSSAIATAASVRTLSKSSIAGSVPRYWTCAVWAAGGASASASTRCPVSTRYGSPSSAQSVGAMSSGPLGASWRPFAKPGPQEHDGHVAVVVLHGAVAGAAHAVVEVDVALEPRDHLRAARLEERVAEEREVGVVGGRVAEQVLGGVDAVDDAGREERLLHDGLDVRALEARARDLLQVEVHVRVVPAAGRASPPAGSARRAPP